MSFPVQFKHGLIYSGENTFSIADGGGWLPGIYDSREAAEKALSVDWNLLQPLWDSILESGRQVLTLKDFKGVDTIA